MSQLLSFPSFKYFSTRNPFDFNLSKHFFVVYIFAHRSGSGPPHQYLQNKNHEKQYSTVWYRVATLNTSHAQNVILRICFFKVVTLTYNPCTMYISSLLIWFFAVHPMLRIYIFITPFSQFLSGFSSIQYLWFVFFLDFDHSCIGNVRINESRNNECT